jgi:hypothetical protein
MRRPRPIQYGKEKWIVADVVEMRASDGITGSRSRGPLFPIYEYWTGEAWDTYQGAARTFDRESDAQEFIDANPTMLATAPVSTVNDFI